MHSRLIVAWIVNGKLVRALAETVAAGTPAGSSGQDHDMTYAKPLLENADPGALLADKPYDADSLIDTLEQRASRR